MVSISNFTRHIANRGTYVTDFAYSDNFDFLGVFFRINLDTSTGRPFIQKAQYRRRRRIEDDEFRLLSWPVVGPSMSVI
jgi:hypothetical protein